MYVLSNIYSFPDTHSQRVHASYYYLVSHWSNENTFLMITVQYYYCSPYTLYNDSLSLSDFQAGPLKLEILTMALFHNLGLHLY